MPFNYKPEFFFGWGLSNAASVIYTLRLDLNPSNSAPLTALTGTNATQVATSSVTVVTEAGLLETIAANLPAIEGANYAGSGTWTVPDGVTATPLSSGLTRYTGNTYGQPGLGVLAEPAATNLCLQSQEFDATWTASELTVDDQAAVAPDGTTTADKLIPSIVDTGTHNLIQAITLTDSTYTFSVYAKAAGYNFLAMKSEAAGYVEFNLATGAAPTIIGGVYTAAITALADGWYRCSITYTGTAASYQQFLYVYNATGAGSYAGDGTSGIYLWGAQLETGSVATSYIPTTTAAVTRASRFLQIAGSELGTDFHVDANVKSLGTEMWFVGINATAGLYKNASDQVVATDGTTTLTSTTTMTANTPMIIGVDWTNGVLYINGTAEDTDAAMEKPVADATVIIGGKVGTPVTNVCNGSVALVHSSNDAIAEEVN